MVINLCFSFVTYNFRFTTIQSFVITRLTKASSIKTSSSTKSGTVNLWQENNTNISKYQRLFMWCFVVLLGLSHFKTSCLIKWEWGNKFKTINEGLKNDQYDWRPVLGEWITSLKIFVPDFIRAFVCKICEYTILPSQVKRLFEPMGTSVLLLRMSQTQQKPDENRELRGD